MIWLRNRFSPKSAFAAALVLCGVGAWFLLRLSHYPLVPHDLFWFAASWALALALLIASGLAGLRASERQRQSRQHLEEMKGLQQGLLASASQIIIACDQENDLFLFNPAAEKTLGYSHEEATVLLKAQDLFAEGEWEKASGGDVSSGAHEVEMLLRRRDGSSLPARVRLVALGRPPSTRGWLAMATDLSAARQAEQVLRESENRYRDAFENSAEMIATISPQGRVLDANPAWQAHFGQTTESLQDLVGFESAFPPEVQAEAAVLFRRALHGERIERVPLKLSNLNGPPVEVEAGLNCRFEEGRPVWVRCVLRDVTPRNRRERRLALQLKISQIVGESTLPEEALSRVLDALGSSLNWDCAYLWIVDEDQARVRFRSSWASPVRACTEFRRESAASAFSRGQDLPGAVWAHGSPVWMADLAEDPGFSRRDAARTDKLASGWGTPVRVGNQVIGVIEFFSRQRQKEDREMMVTVETACASLGQFLARSAQDGRVRELDRQKEFILNSVADGILGTDAEGKVVFANPAAARMLGAGTASLIARSLHSIVHGARSGQGPCSGQCGVEQALQSRETGHGQDIFYRSDGTSFSVEFSATPMSVQGTAAGAVLSFRDVSQRDALDRLKDEFIATVSHELRTPLTSIRGALGLLSTGLLGGISDKAANLLRIAVSNSDRLVLLINGILDLERLQSGRAPLSIGLCALHDIARQAIDNMAPMAENARVRLTVEPGIIPIEADPDRLMQVVTNLLSNADKFSPPGSDVEMAIVSAPGGVQLTVTDQGRGIPAGKLESIFDRFEQIDASDAKQRGGTGLGLAICRTIVQQHGGRIWAGHNPAGGSIFNVYLPSRHPAAQDRPQELATAASGFYPSSHAAQLPQLEIDAPEVAKS